MATRNRLKGEDADFLDSDVIGLVKSGEHSPVAETARDSKTTISIEVPAVSYSTGHHGTNVSSFSRSAGLTLTLLVSSCTVTSVSQRKRHW